MAAGTAAMASSTETVDPSMLLDARPHQTLTKANGGRKTTPAMAAGKADRVCTLAEIVKLLNFELPAHHDS